MLGRTPSGAQDRFIVSTIALQQIVEAGRRAQYYALFSILEVMMNPGHIYQGLKRQGYEDGLCYAGRPKMFNGAVYDSPPEGYVFVVCVKDWVIFEWGWEQSHPSVLDAPIGSETRFDKEIQL